MDKIPDWINEVCGIFPCMIQQINGQFQINWGKVAQSLVVVAVIASSTSFVTVKVLEAQFQDLKMNIREDIVDVKSDQRELKGFINDLADDTAENLVKIEYRLDILEDK